MPAPSKTSFPSYATLFFTRFTRLFLVFVYFASSLSLFFDLKAPPPFFLPQLAPPNFTSAFYGGENSSSPSSSSCSFAFSRRINRRLNLVLVLCPPPLCGPSKHSLQPNSLLFNSSMLFSFGDSHTITAYFFCPAFFPSFPQLPFSSFPLSPLFCHLFFPNYGTNFRLRLSAC